MLLAAGLIYALLSGIALYEIKRAGVHDEYL